MKKTKTKIFIAPKNVKTASNVLRTTLIQNTELSDSDLLFLEEMGFTVVKPTVNKIRVVSVEQKEKISMSNAPSTWVRAYQIYKEKYKSNCKLTYYEAVTAAYRELNKEMTRLEIQSAVDWLKRMI